MSREIKWADTLAVAALAFQAPTARSSRGAGTRACSADTLVGDALPTRLQPERRACSGRIDEYPVWVRLQGAIEIVQIGPQIRHLRLGAAAQIVQLLAIAAIHFIRHR